MLNKTVPLLVDERLILLKPAENAGFGNPFWLRRWYYTTTATHCYCTISTMDDVDAPAVNNHHLGEPLSIIRLEEWLLS